MKHLHWAIFGTLFLVASATAEKNLDSTKLPLPDKAPDKKERHLDLSPMMWDTEKQMNLLRPEYQFSPFIDFATHQNTKWLDHGFKSMDGSRNR